MSVVPSVKLNNGTLFPVLGFGTYLANDGEGEQAIKDAIDAGYRHFDTAFFYGNEVEVGNAIRSKISEGVIKREDVVVVTKLWNSFHDPELVKSACQKSIDNLNLGPIDVYLMHTPMGYQYNGGTNQADYLPKTADGSIAGSDVDYLDTWKAMEKLQEEGLVRSIGVSNFNSEQITRILKEATIRPVTNQVECSPNLNQRKLNEFCKSYDIVLTAFSPLGRPYHSKNSPSGGQLALFDPRVQPLMDKYKKTAAQISLRYLVQNGVVPIPKSSNKGRIQDNINIFDFELTEEDLKIMDTLNTDERTVPFALCTKLPHFPFNIEF